MKKKNLTVLGLGMLLSLTGCGAGEIVHEVDQRLSHDTPAGVVTIKFWHCLGHDKAQNLRDIVNKFNEENPHYYVDQVEVGGGYSGLHTAVKNAIRTGSVPAMAIGYPDSFSEYMGVKETRSNILRINNFYNDSIYGIDPKPESETGEIQPVVNKDFIPSYFDEGTGYQFEGLWSLPMYKSTEVMFYNMDYFNGLNDVNKKAFGNEAWWKQYAEDAFKDEEGASIKYYSNAGHDLYEAALANLREKVVEHGGKVYNVPTTWDEMIATGKQVLADRKAAEVYWEEFYPIGYDSDSNLFISQMMQRGMKYTTNDKDEVKKPLDHVQFNNDETIALADELYKLYKDDHVLMTKGMLSATGTRYVNKEFTGEGTGVINMVMSIGSTGGADYQDTNNFPVGIAPVPYKVNTPLKYIQQGPSICFLDNENEQINTGSWLFYKYLADPVNNVALATANSYDPIRESSYTKQEYLDFQAKYKRSLLSGVSKVTATVRDQLFTSPVFVGSSTCRDEIGNLLSYMRWNKLGASAALSKAYGLVKLAVK